MSPILILLPFAIIELAMKIVALRDLWMRDDVDQNNRLIWTAVIVVVGTFGWLAYFVVGRQKR